MWASLALFALPLLATGLLALWRPDLAQHLLGQEQLAQLERMYDSADPARALGRESGDDWRMFGHYVMNNISIGLHARSVGPRAAAPTMRPCKRPTCAPTSNARPCSASACTWTRPPS